MLPISSISSPQSFLTDTPFETGKFKSENLVEDEEVDTVIHQSLCLYPSVEAYRVGSLTTT